MKTPLMCDDGLLQKDLKDHIYIVTGANSGIGLVTSEQLAKQGAKVVLAARRVEEISTQIQRMIAEGIPSERMIAMHLDLADLESVRRFCQEVTQKISRLDGLVNNAGVMNTPLSRTKNGFEMQFGVNHLGHFALTLGLMEILKSSAPSRIVNVSSCFHDEAMGYKGTIDFDDPNFEERPYQGWLAYAQSKLANVLHAKALANRYGRDGVTAVSLHPGWVRTALAKHTMPLWVQDTLMRPLLRLAGMIEPWEGAQTTLHCLLDDKVPSNNGAFYSQLGKYSRKECNKGGWQMRSPNDEANDQDVADKLWKLSTSLVGAENS